MTGTVIKRDCVYTPNGKNRPLHIYLPAGYETSGERYPVMYFFDGHNLFSDADATYGKSWGLKEFLDRWEKPMIVVGMECGHEGYERMAEYLPYPADYGAQPMGEATFRWIRETVKPMIDAEYRTWPFRECTAIGGSSMGGLMALYGVVRHNDCFSKGACVSSAIGFCPDAVMLDVDECAMKRDTRVYLSWGTKEAHGLEDTDHEDRSSRTYFWNKAVADKVTGRGARARLDCQVGGGHCEADWEKLIPHFMDFLWLDR